MLKTFKIENYKMFKNATINFSIEPRIKSHFKDSIDGVAIVSSISGGNASGKTTLLNAVRLYFRMLGDGDYILSESVRRAKVEYNSNRGFQNLRDGIFSEEDEYDAETGFNQSKFNAILENKHVEVEGEITSLFRDLKKPLIFSHEYVSNESRLIGEISITFDGSKVIIDQKVTTTINGVAQTINKGEEFNEEFLDLLDNNNLTFFSHYFSATNPRLHTHRVFVKDKNLRGKITSIAKVVDPNILDLDFLPDGTIHGARVGSIDNESHFVPYKHLSQGTIKIINLFNILSDIANSGAKTIIMIDEFDTYLHPTLAEWLTNLMREGHFGESQFILTTHNPNLLNNFRKDQIFLINNNEVWRANDLNIRQDSKFSNVYMNGNISSAPSVENYFNFLDDWNGE